MKKKYLLLVFLACSFQLFAQYGKQKKADAQFNTFAYVKAIKTFQELIENDYNSQYALQKIADAYSLLRDPERAVIYYAKAVDNPNVDPEYFLKYAFALRGIKQYDASREWLIKYKNTVSIVDPYIDKIIKNKDFITAIYEAKQRYNVVESAFNTKFSDFGAYLKDSVLYIASTRDDSGAIKRLYGWNMQPFLDIYTVSIDTNGIVTANKLEGDINTKVHEGAITITKDGNTMFFTRTNYLNKKGKDQNGVSSLKLYKATRIKGQWKNIKELPFNSDSFSNGHPTLSNDDETLYFVSDRPGGIGNSDIYKVAILGDDRYGSPENLGKEINTSYNEVFPFMHDNGTLFFSSDGHQGLGQLDIFATITDEENKVVEILNLGTPINTSQDDFSYFLSADGVHGYIASNRKNGAGDDDIYSFERIPQISVQGRITDAINKLPIANASITFYDANNELVEVVTSNSQGMYQFNVDINTNYTLIASETKYHAEKITIATTKPKVGNHIEVNFELQPIQKLELIADVDINKIYFDFDRFYIRRDAAKELDKVINIMLKIYPNMVIAIGSHTDSRGEDSYNLRLSKNRALATYRYLVKNGLPKERIQNYDGFGEMELITPCDDGQECSEEEHELNRRSEFVVIKMD
jgi:outer membrane protein OmpA-like peptidoglycan-associated protein/tetratricopeptide (TPR) repeat protein